jgi:hypothetical protein
MLANLESLYSISEVAEKLLAGKVSSFSVRRWIAKGCGTPKVKLPAVRLGNQYFVDKTDLETFLQAINEPELHRKRQKSERVTKARRKLLKAGC